MTLLPAPQLPSDESKDADPRLEPIVRVFGGMGVDTAEGPLSIGGPRQRRLLALLTMRAGSVVSLDWLSEYLWSDGDRPAAPERAIRTYVSRLRLSLPEALQGWIETAGLGYRLVAPAESVEHRRFSILRADARRARDRDDPAAAHAVLDEALSMWRGDPFVELDDLDWARAEIERLQLDRLEMLEERWETALALGRHTQITGELATFTARHSHRDRAVRQYALALYRSGRTPEALRALSNHRRSLADETGLDPTAEVVDLERSILDGDPSLDVETVGVPLRGYRLLEQAGTGAFSIVWKGMQPSVDREVAIKQIRAELASRPEFIRRFEAEARLVAHIEHPHIVPLIDYWRDPDSAYLVMRWLSGGTLERRLDDGRLSIVETLTLARQIGGALSAAHGHGVIHRDVKTANILFDDSGHAFLGDFGIAMSATESAGPEAALSPGSPVYAAPEQIRHEQLGPEADVFSLGVVLYECFAGAPPFPAVSSVDEMIDRQLHTPFPALTTLADVPLAVSDAVERATAKAPGDRFTTIADFVKALDAAVEASPAEVGNDGTGSVLINGDVANPYIGLRAFDETDTDRFFGRERLVDQLVERLSGNTIRSRCVVVIGPSGSGKSSVVRAGLIPALRNGAAPGSERWFTTTMVPGTDPFESIEAALLRIAVHQPSSLHSQLRDGPRGILRGIRRCISNDNDRVLLVIDQFEELFTRSPERSADTTNFLDALAVAVEDPTTPLRVVITLRADYFHRPLEHAAFAPILSDTAVTVMPLAADELERAIVEPARRAGVGFEPGLVARLVAESSGQPSPLPLLQYTLGELFDRRQADSAVLSIDLYDELGGLSGALATRADALYDTGNQQQQATIRRVFGQLTSPDQDGADLRRRRAVADLGTDQTTKWVLEQYSLARLLTFDRDTATREPTVEIAHEALLREWPRLAMWLTDDAELLTTLDGIATAANAWGAGGRVETDLYRGGRLDTAIDVANAAPGHLRSLDQEFVAASRAAGEEERKAEQSRLVRLRRLVGAAAVALVVALVAGGIAWRQSERADNEARAAEREAATAVEANEEAQAQTQLADERASAERAATDRARVAAIVSNSAALRTENPEVALLLALEADTRASDATTRQAVLNALVERGLPQASVSLYSPPDDDSCTGGAQYVSADGGTRFFATEAAMISQNLLTGEVIDHGPPPEACAAWIGDPDVGLRWAGFLGGGHWFGPYDGELTPIDGRRRGGPLTRAFAGDRLLFGANGPNGPTAIVVDATTGEQVGTPLTELVLSDPQSAAVNPDGTAFAVGAISPEAPGDPSGDGRLFLIDAATGAETLRVALANEVVRVAFDPSSGEIITLSRQGELITIDPSNGEVLAQTEVAVNGFDRLGVRPDGLVVITSRGQVELIDRRAGRVATPLRLLGRSVIRADGTVINVVDGRARLVNLDTGPLIESSWPVDPSALVEFGVGQAGVVRADGTAEIVDLTTGERSTLELVDTDGVPFPAIAVYPEQEGVLAFSDDGRIGRWTDGRQVEETTAPTNTGSLTISRGQQSDLDDGPPGAAFAGLGALLGYNRITGSTEENYLLDLNSGQLGVPLRISGLLGLDVSAYPAADGGLHVMGSTGRMRTYDASGTRTTEIETGLMDLSAVAGVTSTGLLAFGGPSGAVIIDPGSESVEILDDVGSVATLGFAREGELLVIVGADGTVRLWDIDLGQPVGIVWKGIGGASPSPPFYDASSDSIWVATSGRLVKIPLDPSAWIERACEVIDRQLTEAERDRFVPGGDPPTPVCGGS